MKRFEFRLKSVLLLRRRLLNEAEQVYTSAIQKRRLAEQKLQSGYEQLAQMNEKVVSVRDEFIAGYQQESFMLAMQHAKNSLGQLESVLQEAKSEESQAKMKYIDANKNHELLLKLQEKQHSEHLQNELLKEQLIQDDLFNARRSIMNAV